MNNRYSEKTTKFCREFSPMIEHGKEEFLRKKSSEAMEFILKLDEQLTEMRSERNFITVYFWILFGLFLIAAYQ